MLSGVVPETLLEAVNQSQDQTQLALLHELAIGAVTDVVSKLIYMVIAAGGLVMLISVCMNCEGLDFNIAAETRLEEDVAQLGRTHDLASAS